MDTLRPLGLIGGLAFLLFCGSASAGTNTIEASVQTSLSNTTSLQTPLQGMQLARDYVGSGRIRSYEYCSRNVYEPCREAGGSYRYCNRQHHLCTYGHLENCIGGSRC